MTMTKIIQRMQVLGALLLVGLGLIITSVALAAPTTQPAPVINVQQWWMPLLTPLLAMLGTVIVAIVAKLLHSLLQVLKDKYHIEVPASIEAILNDKAKQLIAAAEEEAENKLLHGDGTQTPGAVKSQQVIAALLKFADQAGYGEQYRVNEITQIVNGVLHLNRIGSVGVIGSNGERGKLLTKAVDKADKADKVGK